MSIALFFFFHSSSKPICPVLFDRERFPIVSLVARFQDVSQYLPSRESTRDYFLVYLTYKPSCKGQPQHAPTSGLVYRDKASVDISWTHRRFPLSIRTMYSIVGIWFISRRHLPLCTSPLDISDHLVRLESICASTEHHMGRIF